MNRAVSPPAIERKNFSPRLIARKAKKHPKANSGTALPRNAYVQRFSLAYSPGATKAQS